MKHWKRSQVGVQQSLVRMNSGMGQSTPSHSLINGHLTSRKVFCPGEVKVVKAPYYFLHVEVEFKGMLNFKKHWKVES